MRTGTADGHYRNKSLSVETPQEFRGVGAHVLRRYKWASCIGQLDSGRFLTIRTLQLKGWTSEEF